MKTKPFFLTMALFMGMGAATAQTIIAAGTCGAEGDGGNLQWTLTDDGTLAISGTGAMAAPSLTDDQKLLVQTVIMAEGVTSIGEYAFRYCSGLQSIAIPNGVTSIGNSAFLGCSGLQSIAIPNRVTSIGEYAFYDCSGLQSVAIPNGVTSIGNFAFYGCRGLQFIVIPASVTGIGRAAFAGCTGIAEFIVSDDNPVYSSADGVLFSKDKSRLIAYPVARKGDSYEIPESVTHIGDYAFDDCRGLQSIAILNGVTSIGRFAFSYCIGLQSIAIPNGVTGIGDFAFAGCGGLQSIAIPNGVTSIGRLAFSGCSGLQSVCVKRMQPLDITKFVFDNVDMNACTLYVPTGSKAAYEAAAVWKEFKNIVETDYPTAVPETPRSEETVCVEGGVLVVRHAAAGTPVRVYTPAGALVQSLQVTAGSVELALPQTGVYIVQVGGRAYKVMNN